MAAWLASFRPPDGDLYLTGFPTDHRLPGGTTLRQAYAEAPDSLEPFAALADLPLTAIIILDADGFGQLIDFVGGVPAGEETVDGQSAVNVLALLDDEPQASLLAQARLLQALSARADRVQPGTDLQPLLDVASMHTTVSIPARDVLTAVAPFLPFTADRIHVSPPGSAPDSGD
jgi:hypothetical protein